MSPAHIFIWGALLGLFVGLGIGVLLGMALQADRQVLDAGAPRTCDACRWDMGP